MKEIIEGRILDYKSDLHYRPNDRELLSKIEELEDLLQIIPPTTTLTQLHADIKAIVVAGGINDNLSVEARTDGSKNTYAAIMWNARKCKVFSAESIPILHAELSAEFVKDNLQVNL